MGTKAGGEPNLGHTPLRGAARHGSRKKTMGGNITKREGLDTKTITFVRMESKRRVRRKPGNAPTQQWGVEGWGIKGVERLDDCPTILKTDEMDVLGSGRGRDCQKRQETPRTWTGGKGTNEVAV